MKARSEAHVYTYNEVCQNKRLVCLQARFALKHHAIKYRTTPYLPLIGELKLRLRLWEWNRKITVPVMFTPKDGVLIQSYDIAVWADKNSAQPEAERLFPPGREDEVSRYGRARYGISYRAHTQYAQLNN